MRRAIFLILISLLSCSLVRSEETATVGKGSDDSAEDVMQVDGAKKHSFRYVGYCETGYLHETYKSFAEDRDRLAFGSNRDERLNYQYLTTTHGFEFKDILFLGVGVGMNYYTKYQRVTFPIFGDLRISCLRNKPVIPYVTLRYGEIVGGDKDECAGMFWGINVGVKCRIRGDKYLFASINSTTHFMRHNVFSGADALGGSVGFQF